MSEILNEEQNKEALELFGEEFGKDKKEELESEDSSFNERYVDTEEINFTKDIGTSKSSLKFEMFTQPLENTEHLTGFDLMDLDLGLEGEAYKPLKMALYYFQNSLRQDNVHYKINHKTKIDNRPHLLIVSSPGTGKTTIKNQNKRVLKNYEDVEGVIEVSGVSHPEQLVGKIVYKGKGDNKRPETKMGILGYKCVMNDEAQDMLNEKNDVYAKAQRLKRIGMDTYGDNKISKKLVADDPKDVLEYDSPSRVCDFMHPVKLDSPFFTTGSFRRYYAFNVDLNPEISLKNVTDFNFDVIINKKENWLYYLDWLYSEQTNVEFTKETLDIISHFHKCLLYYLLKHKNPTAMRYALQTRYSMRGMFCKNVLILAKGKKEKKPSLFTTLSACRDTLLFILKSIETYNDLGNMGVSSDVWGGVNENDAEALEFLLKEKAFTKESSNITIKRFQTILCNFYGCKLTQARGHHYRLKRDGFVNSSQDGRHNSKVWLKFIPKEINLNSEGFDPLKFWDSYLKGIRVKNRFLIPLKKMFTDDKAFDKAKGSGDVGVLGCIFSIYYICVEVYGDKYKYNNIYTSTPNISIPSIPLKNLHLSPTINKETKAIKTPKILPIPSKSDRDLQFFEAPECDSIIPTCKKEDVLKWIKKNPNGFNNFKELDDEFGIGSLKYRNELKQEGLI